MQDLDWPFNPQPGLCHFIQSSPGIREKHSTNLRLIVLIHSTFFRERHIRSCRPRVESWANSCNRVYHPLRTPVAHVRQMRGRPAASGMLGSVYVLVSVSYCRKGIKSLLLSHHPVIVICSAPATLCCFKSNRGKTNGVYMKKESHSLEQLSDF